MPWYRSRDNHAKINVAHETKAETETETETETENETETETEPKPKLKPKAKPKLKLKLKPKPKLKLKLKPKLNRNRNRGRDRGHGHLHAFVRPWAVAEVGLSRVRDAHRGQLHPEAPGPVLGPPPDGRRPTRDFGARARPSGKYIRLPSCVVGLQWFTL